MQLKDFQSHPEKTVIKKTIAVAGTYYPDLNLASVFRLDCSGYDTIMGLPKNPRDGQYLRLELVSAENMDIQFAATGYHINGAVIADDTHEDNVLLNMEGWYNSTTAVWNMSIIAVLAA